MTTTRQLEIFVKVAELQSVREAAEQLNISQPTASKHLKALERNVGGALFERCRGKRSRLSRLGKQVLGDAIESLSAGQRINSVAIDTVAIATPRIFVRGFMHDIIKKRYEGLLKAGLPQGASFVLVDDQEDLFEKVRTTPGSVSLLRCNYPHQAVGLLHSVMRTEAISLFAAPELASALKEGELPPQKVDFLRFGRQQETLRWSELLLKSSGLEQVNRVAAPQFIELVLGKVERGEGISVFLDWHVSEAVEQGRLVKVSPAAETAYLMLIGHPGFDRQQFANLYDVLSSVWPSDGALTQ